MRDEHDGPSCLATSQHFHDIAVSRRSRVLFFVTLNCAWQENLYSLTSCFPRHLWVKALCTFENGTVVVEEQLIRFLFVLLFADRYFTTTGSKVEILLLSDLALKVPYELSLFKREKIHPNGKIKIRATKRKIHSCSYNTRNNNLVHPTRPRVSVCKLTSLKVGWCKSKIKVVQFLFKHFTVLGRKWSNSLREVDYNWSAVGLNGDKWSFFLCWCIFKIAM